MNSQCMFTCMIVRMHFASDAVRRNTAVASRRRPCRPWLCALVSLLLAGINGYAMAGSAQGEPAAASAIVGDWLVANRGAVIRIQQAGDKFDGYIAWQLHDTYGPEDGPALDGKVVTDRNNPDPALRARPLTGLRLLTGLQYNRADNKWTGGEVYDTDNGRTYHCMVRLASPNRLVFRGYIGIPLFGKNTYWTRVIMRSPVPGGLPYVMAVSSH
ncbi:MAG: DUF2147 domain-containing protein [Rhodanobacteraceae bacterium]|nr:MAG: DUF2147 domain-containing protein [Rhodanobacteraceae bacterium]